MSRSALLALTMATLTTAQASFATSGFTYVGCVSAPSASFPVIIDFFAPFTPDQCQDSCAGKATFAAIGGGCQCDTAGSGDAVKFEVVDEAKCSTLCVDGDESKGHCGGPADGEKGLYNLYKKGGDAAAPVVSTMVEDCDDVPMETKLPILPSTSIKTIFSCGPEVPDCPYRMSTPSSTPTPPPPPPPPATTPAVFNKVPVGPCPPEPCMPACPPEGCPPCPPEGCLPACAPDCPAVLSTPVLALNTTSTPCPGCSPAPVVTPSPVPSPVVPTTPVAPVPTTSPPVLGAAGEVRVSGVAAFAAAAVAVAFWAL